MAASHGERFILVLGTHSIQVGRNESMRQRLQHALGVSDLFYVERRLEALARREGIQVIPLAYEMQRRAVAGAMNFHGFGPNRTTMGHWNQSGHRVAAELIARRLCGDRS